MGSELISQGAESRLYLGNYDGQRCLIKERFVKEYRHPELDCQLTRQRIKAENRANERCQKIDILVPKVYHVNLQERKIYMEYYENAITAKQYIKRLVKECSREDWRVHLNNLCQRIGKIISNMHLNNIIHGDLTTSNILINFKENGNWRDEYDIISIDFGLSQYNQGAEAKGVDLYVLERALLATHSELPFLFETILGAYKDECGHNGSSPISKFQEVRARGRKRTMIG